MKKNVEGYNVILFKLKTMSAINDLVIFICMTPSLETCIQLGWYSSSLLVLHS